MIASQIIQHLLRVYVTVKLRQTQDQPFSSTTCADPLLDDSTITTEDNITVLQEHRYASTAQYMTTRLNN